MENLRMHLRGLLAVSLLASVPLVARAAVPASDDQIESSIKDSHVFKSYLKDDAIDVDSKNGVVTLSGTVAEKSHKSLAEDTAESVDGVKRVDDKLFVKGNGMQSNSDGWLATKVKTALMFHRNVSGLKTEVSAHDGAVTLRGSADSAASKDLATQYVQDIDGVKSVDNQLVVQNTANSNAGTTASAGSASNANANDQTASSQQSLGEKIDDASITAQVKAVLLYHKSTSALKTRVQTNDGVVTLSGTAKNSAEKDLVSKLVQDVNGVKDVKNNMTVAPGANG